MSSAITSSTKPPKAPTADIEQELARLQRAYKTRLYIELSFLVNRARELAVGPGLAWKLTEIHGRLHKLAGSGGSFGFHQLSVKARHLELIADEWLRDSSQVDSAAIELFSNGINDLKDIAESDAPTPAAGTSTDPTRPVGDGCGSGSSSSGDAGAAAQGMASPSRAYADPITKIGLVDTDTTRINALTELIEGFGHRLVRHRDLPSALHDCTHRPPLDLILLDIDGTGLTSASAEAQDNINALRDLRCPIVALSTQEDFATRKVAAEVGAIGFLLFPAEPTRVIDTLERIISPVRAAPYRVLIIDDDVELASLYRLHLTQAGMEAAVLHQPRDVAETISRFRPELILLDIQMPECSGPALARIIRQFDEWVGLPIVYLSAEVDFDKQVAAQSCGAEAFLIKPLPAEQLVAAVTARIKRSRQLVDLMDKDSLTGLLKHSKIKEQVQTELARLRRENGVLSVVMLDIDHFKHVNDTFGHASGDRVIKALAQMLRRRLRVSDGLGRYGGEEFLLVLPNTPPGDAETVLEQLRIRFAALQFKHNSATFSCTFSAGIAAALGNQPAVANDLIQAADQALYQAKNAGRNRTVLAT